MVVRMSTITRTCIREILVKSYRRLFVHLVWHIKSSEYRLHSKKERFVHDEIRTICDELGLECFAVNSAWNHTHVLVSFEPRHSIADIVQRFKGRTAFLWNNPLGKQGEARRPRKLDRLEWKKSYGAFTIRQEGTADVKTYIHRQKEHHARSPEKLRPELERTEE